MKYLLISLLTIGFISCQDEGNNSEPTSDTISTVDSGNNEGELPQETVEFVPMEILLEEIEEIPFELDYDGVLVDCFTWADVNGINFLVRSMEEPEMHYSEEYDMEYRDQNLHVYHYVQTGIDECELVRDLTDFVKDCELDLNMSHIESVELGDLDADNIAEIIFGYRLACTGDVSPSIQKVVMFEYGDKYILRGESEVFDYGGEYEKGSELDDAPEGFLEALETYWEANKVEYEFEDNEF